MCQGFFFVLVTRFGWFSRKKSPSGNVGKLIFFIGKISKISKKFAIKKKQPTEGQQRQRWENLREWISPMLTFAYRGEGVGLHADICWHKVFFTKTIYRGIFLRSVDFCWHRGDGVWTLDRCWHLLTVEVEGGQNLAKNADVIYDSSLNQTVALLSFGWVFGVQLDYSYRLKSVSATAEKRVKVGLRMGLMQGFYE